MKSSHNLTLEAEPKAVDMNTIVQGLLSYNCLLAGHAPPEHLVVTVRDADETVVGGLVAVIDMGWLHVHALWLPAPLRGNGFGGALLALAEKEAERRGCANACLETFSVQALAFYEKCGYAVFGQLANYPVGGAKYFLAKTLETGS